MLIVHLDGGDAVGGLEVSITREGYEAILKEVVGPGLIAVNTCVDMMCVSITRATTGARPIERERRWVLLKIPRCDIDGVGEGK